MANQIVYALALSLHAHLDAGLRTAMPSAYQEVLTFTARDETEQVMKAGKINIGRYQDDPERLGESSQHPSVLVAIHYHDPQDMGQGWKHTLVSAVESSAVNAAYRIPTPYEIGGGEMWWRRFLIEFSIYYIDADLAQRNAARLTAGFLGALEQCTNSASRVNTYGWNCAMTGAMGETAVRSQVIKSHAWEGGGPDDDYLWRGAVWTQVLTSKQC